MITITKEYIRIEDAEGVIATWDRATWQKRPDLIPAIAYMIKTYYESGSETARMILLQEDEEFTQALTLMGHA